jgi:hypothetical protein
MAKKKITGDQLKMSFREKKQNIAREKKASGITPPKKPTPPTPPKKATPPAAPNTGNPAAEVKKSNTYVKDRVKRTDALRAKTFKTEADVSKRKVDKLRTGNPANNKGKAALDAAKKVAKKGKDIKGKAMLAVYGAAALTAAATSGIFDKKKGTAIKAGAKKAASTVKKPDTKKVETKKPVVPKTTPEKTTPKVDNTSIEQKAKDVMRGKYGSGADRKKALGADYDKVQAIINKQMASSKPKTAPAKTVTAPAKTVTAPEKMEIKKAGPIEYTGPKELAMTAEQKMNANIDKSKKEKMRKGGMVKSKRK